MGKFAKAMKLAPFADDDRALQQVVAHETVAPLTLTVAQLDQRIDALDARLREQEAGSRVMAGRMDDMQVAVTHTVKTFRSTTEQFAAMHGRVETLASSIAELSATLRVQNQQFAERIEQLETVARSISEVADDTSGCCSHVHSLQSDLQEVRVGLGLTSLLVVGMLLIRRFTR